MKHPFPVSESTRVFVASLSGGLGVSWGPGTGGFRKPTALALGGCDLRSQEAWGAAQTGTRPGLGSRPPCLPSRPPPGICLLAEPRDLGVKPRPPEVPVKCPRGSSAGDREAGGWHKARSRRDAGFAVQHHLPKRPALPAFQGTRWTLRPYVTLWFSPLTSRDAVPSLTSLAQTPAA